MTPCLGSNSHGEALLHLLLFGLIHLWVDSITFMVGGFIKFVVKSYYTYGQFLLHLWLALHLWVICMWCRFISSIYARCMSQNRFKGVRLTRCLEGR